MGIAALKTYSNNKFYLTANADNRDITISAADSVILSNWAQHFGTRKCRLLLSTFAKQDQQNYSHTTFVVSGIDTATGVIIPHDNIPNHTNYTTTGYSFVSINLIPDGDNAQYGSGWLNTTGLTNFKDHSMAVTECQSLYCQATTASGEGYIDLTVSGLESYNLSFWYQTGLSGQQLRVQCIDQTNIAIPGYNETIIDSGLLDAQKWTYYSGGLVAPNHPAECTAIRVKFIGVNADDRFWIDRFNVTQSINTNTGFEDTGKSMVPNFNFEGGYTGTPDDGVEDAITGGWGSSAQIITVNALVGTNSIKVTSLDDGNDRWTSCNVYDIDIHRLYSYSAYVYVQSASAVAAEVKYWVSAVGTRGQWILPAIDNDSWYKLTPYIHHTLSDHRELRAYYYSPSASGQSAWFDAYQSFPWPSDQWAWSGPDASVPTITQDTDNQKSGTRCIKIASSDSDSYLYNETPTISGNYYRIKTNVKTSGAGTATVVQRDLGVEVNRETDFSNPAWWSYATPPWSIADNQATTDNTAGHAVLDDESDPVTIIGQPYFYSVDHVGGIGDFYIRIGNVASQNITSNGRWTGVVTGNTTTGPQLRATATGSANSAVIENFSVRKQHSTKSLTTASGEYQELSYVYKAEGITARLEYYNDGGDIYIDDLVIEPLEVITPSTETPSVAADSYNVGRWGTPDNAFRVDGSDTLTWTTDSRLGNQTGSFGINVLMMPHDSYPQDAYLWGVENVFRLYYDSTNYQFKFDIYDGAAWQTARGPTMTNTVSGWKHICATWDNSDGADIYVNTASGYRHGESWTAQALPTDMYICSHWAGNKQWDTAFDDAVIYQNTLSAANVVSRFDA